MSLDLNETRVGECEIYFICIEVKDNEKHIHEIIKTITNSSWILSLDEISKRSYKPPAERTTVKLVEIFTQADNKISSEIGEFLVSVTAQLILESKKKHVKVPLAELWKTRVTGNDGFDFHTITDVLHLNFGEAKFNRHANAYTIAAEQILGFIRDSKDDADLVHLRNFKCVQDSKPDLEKANFNYTIAFSMKGKCANTIMKNVMESEKVQDLIKISKKLYIIGVKIASIQS